MSRALRNNGLAIAAFALFAISFAGQLATGWRAHSADEREHGRPAPTFAAYLRSGHLVEATFENWESEFFQMGLFVVLTTMLRQKGSSESKSLEGGDEVDEDPRAHRHDPDAPWPVRRGGLALALYERSLSGALFLLFAISFALHAEGGAREYSSEQLAHGGAAVTVWQFLATSQFWFQSFQNWQSEFLSVGVLVVLTIWLRDRGSPQSKPVAAPHAQTGE
ncbi:MAG TPA: DUF6766 family protein [Gemmatimonadaceae bacterium]